MNLKFVLSHYVHSPADTILADFSKLGTDLGCQDVSQRHQLGSLVSGIAEHVALVTGTDLLGLLGTHTVDTLANVRALRVDVHQNLEETVQRARVATTMVSRFTNPSE